MITDRDDLIKSSQIVEAAAAICSTSKVSLERVFPVGC